MICGSPSPSKRLFDDGTTSRSLKTPRLSRHRGLLISRFSKHQTFAQGHSSTFNFSLCIFLGSFSLLSVILCSILDLRPLFSDTPSIFIISSRSFTDHQEASLSFLFHYRLGAGPPKELLDTSGFAYPSFGLALTEQHCCVDPSPFVPSPNLGPRRTRRLIKRS